MAKQKLSTGVENLSTRRLIMEVGGAVRAEENRGAWLGRVAEEAGLSDRTVRAAWHGERAGRETIFKLKQAAQKNEYRKYLETAVGLENLAFTLQAKNNKRFGLHIDVFRSCAGQIRALVRTKSKIDRGG